jgi:electron transport complex protein RnfB
VSAPGVPASLAARIDALLPQTQCTRCGYADCAAYAAAIAEGSAGIDRCPPGGIEGVRRLACATGKPEVPLDPACGAEGPLRTARIDEAWCIGCTLCLKVCPVDCIVGSNKLMHTVIEGLCTGCDLCLHVCPVDCIEMVDVSGTRTGWAAWSAEQARRSRQRYDLRRARLERERVEHEARLLAKAEHKRADVAAASRHTDPAVLERKRAVIEAAIARARAREGETRGHGAASHPCGGSGHEGDAP